MKNEIKAKQDIYDINNYFYHTISKDNQEQIYEILNKILDDKELKCQKLLGKSEVKFNGLDYISLASFPEEKEYKTFIIDKENFQNSKLSNIFSTYNLYLEYMKSSEKLEEPISKEEFFLKNNTNDKREYFNYLDTITKKYPVDIEFLYKKTNDEIYKIILELIKDSILYCYPFNNCFEDYVIHSKGITLMFSKNIEAQKATIIPNLPTELEMEVIRRIDNKVNRYSNQLGEYQAKEKISLNELIGIIISKNVDIDVIKEILNKKHYKTKLFKLNDNLILEEIKEN